MPTTFEGVTRPTRFSVRGQAGHSSPAEERKFESWPPRFGLSPKDYNRLVRMMLAVVRRIGCHDHVTPMDVVQDAFVLALYKPVDQRPSVAHEKRFFGWMCALAECAALTNRHSKHQRVHQSAVTHELLEAVCVATAYPANVELQKPLRHAIESLGTGERALIEAHLIDDKTIKEMADEEGLPWSTAKSRYESALRSLRDAFFGSGRRIRKGCISIIAALVLFARQARAQCIDLAQHAPRWLGRSIAQTTYAGGMAMVCGAALPTAGDAFVTGKNEPTMSMQMPARASTSTAATDSTPLMPTDTIVSTNDAVIPVGPPPSLDASATACSSEDMKTTKILGHASGLIVPFGFLLSSALTNVACTGATQQSKVCETPDEPGYSCDEHYRHMCENLTMRGNPCPDKQDWFRSQMPECV